MVENIQQQIEAIVFTSDAPVTISELAGFFTRRSGLEVQEELIEELIHALSDKYQSDLFPFELCFSGGGYMFRTKATHHEVIAAFLQRNTVKKLTPAALETLAIIAYKQPVTKSEIESIRGVNSDHTVQKLLERDLIAISGRSQDIGRPLLYGTTPFFLDYFGINSLNELPRLREFTENENQIGEKENIIQSN